MAKSKQVVLQRFKRRQATLQFVCQWIYLVIHPYFSVAYNFILQKAVLFLFFLSPFFRT